MAQIFATDGSILPTDLKTVWACAVPQQGSGGRLMGILS